MNGSNYIPLASRHVPLQHRSWLANMVHRLNDTLFLSQESEDAANTHARQTQKELRAIGFSRFQIDRRESRHIAKYIDKDEHIRAGIRGHVFGVGGVLMVATNKRILFLHDIPLFTNLEEFAYEVVSGVSINRATYLSSVTVFTKFKTYQVDYVNSQQAERFLHFVESQIYPATLQHANT